MKKVNQMSKKYSISEVIDLTSHRTDSNMWEYFGDFLDYFYNNNTSSEERKELVKQEPKKYDSISDFTYCFVAASVHRLCNLYRIDSPKWVWDSKYTLDEPHFSINAIGNLRLVLIKESPVEFKMRNIFTSSNTLDRV